MMDEQDKDRLARLADGLRSRFMAGDPPGDDFDTELAALTPDEWREITALVRQRIAHAEELLESDSA